MTELNFSEFFAATFFKLNLKLFKRATIGTDNTHH